MRHSTSIFSTNRSLAKIMLTSGKSRHTGGEQKKAPDIYAIKTTSRKQLAL
jgi:hypothetical protein